MKKLIIAFIIGSFLTSCLEIEKRTLIVNQKNKTAILHLNNITSDKEGDEAVEDFEKFMNDYETDAIIKEFYIDRFNLKDHLIKKKIYQQKGKVHAKIVFRYDSLEHLGFNTCTYEDSLCNRIKLNDQMDERVYLQIHQDLAMMSHSFYTNGMILNAFTQLFESDIKLDSLSMQELFNSPFAFSWGKDEVINITYFSHIDESNTSIKDYWKETK
tara:strand:+ start:573 stop:1214 length:642 start_codon:yes stop_codon:yes gene_type:complete